MTRSVTPTAKHLAFRKALEKAIADHALELDAAEILGLLANMVGQVIAMQDQRRYSSAQVMAMVAANIEEGNQQAIAPLLKAGGTPS